MTEPLEPSIPGTPPDPPPEALPAAAEVEPPPLRAYELPTARGVVTFGLSLAYRASSELRRASIYIGLLTVALLGPPVVLLVAFIGHFHIVDEDSLLQYFPAGVPDPVILGPLVLLYAMGLLAIVGWYAVSVDAQLIAVALLAAREGDRAFTLREAVIRARQVFWRMVRGGLLVLVVSTVTNFVVGAILGAIFSRGGTGSDILVSVIAVLLLSPLGYLATGVVLGDVGATESLKRSIRLARARPRIAIVVALFTLVTAGIQLFALLAGVDLFARFADFVHLGIEGGAGPLLVTILGVLALVMAFGSLTFTVGAMVSAPQVAAFLGLTYYTAGLDRARDLPANPRKFRWVTRPMVVLIAVVAVGSLYGLVQVNGSATFPGASDPVVRELSANGRAAQLTGTSAIDDPRGDETGQPEAPADITGGEYLEIYDLPQWLLSDTFACIKPTVACGYGGNVPEVFNDGAVLIVEHLSAAPAVADVRAAGQWASVLDVAGYDPAPADDSRYPGATLAVTTNLVLGALRIHHLTYTDGAWTEYDTFARSAFIGNDVWTLIPVRDEIPGVPLGWSVHTSYSESAASASSTDTIAFPGQPLLGIPDPPPVLSFPDSSQTPSSSP